MRLDAGEGKIGSLQLYYWQPKSQSMVMREFLGTRKYIAMDY